MKKDVRAGRKRSYTAEQRRRWSYVTRYGLTPEQVEQMLADQDGNCGICQNPPARICVDHDHDTGKVRGILCHRCNIGLRYVEDAAYRVPALAYLEGAPA